MIMMSFPKTRTSMRFAVCKCLFKGGSIDFRFTEKANLPQQVEHSCCSVRGSPGEPCKERCGTWPHGGHFDFFWGRSRRDRNLGLFCQRAAVARSAGCGRSSFRFCSGRRAAAALNLRFSLSAGCGRSKLEVLFGRRVAAGPFLRFFFVGVHS
jgi:hypothetical protein